MDNVSGHQPLASSTVSHEEQLMAALIEERIPPELQLGDILIESGLLTLTQLRVALKRQSEEPGKHLGIILTELGMVSKADVNRALAYKFGIPFVVLNNFHVPGSVAEKVPPDIAFQYRVMPLAEHEGRLVVAMENPLDWEAIEVLRFNTNLRVEVVMASPENIAKTQERHYAQFDEAEALEDLDLLTPVAGRRASDEDTTQVIEKEAKKKPIVRLVNAIILQAINQEASDINIRPERDRVNVFYRIDGQLQQVRTLHKTLLPAVVSRIKITGQMNIAERRMPQDGHARIFHRGRRIDLRISCIPTVTGESVVIRILDQSVAVRSLDDLGLRPESVELMRLLVDRPQGMFLVTGPTGSGKSTTLYGIINELKAHNPHILTVEDPVEYDIEGVEQVQIHHQTGYTFAEALRHFLRHDPDVMMVGEIRDLETARIANKAALTGHLVLSTLHTNDAVSTVTRLVDMGVEPYLVSATLAGVMAQRLVRVICPECKEVAPVNPRVRKTLGVEADEKFYTGRGCVACNNLGYRGRRMVSEILAVTPEVADLVNRGGTYQQIKELAVKQGMVHLVDDALALAREGLTSLDEVFAVRLE